MITPCLLVAINFFTAAPPPLLGSYRYSPSPRVSSTTSGITVTHGPPVFNGSATLGDRLRIILMYRLFSRSTIERRKTGFHRREAVGSSLSPKDLQFVSVTLFRLHPATFTCQQDLFLDTMRRPRRLCCSKSSPTFARRAREYPREARSNLVSNPSDAPNGSTRVSRAMSNL